MEDNLIFFLIASFILFFAILIFIAKREEKEQKRQRHEEYRIWCETVKKDFSHWLAQNPSSIHDKARHPFMLWLANVGNHFPGMLPGETLNCSGYQWYVDTHYQLFLQYKLEYEQNIHPKMQKELQKIERIKEYLAAPRILSQMHESEKFSHADVPEPSQPSETTQPEPVAKDVPRPSPRRETVPSVHDVPRPQPPTATADILRILTGVKITVAVLLPIMYLCLPTEASRTLAVCVLVGCGITYFYLTILCLKGYVAIPEGFENTGIFRLHFQTPAGGVAKAVRKYYHVIQNGGCKILSNVSSSLSVLIFLGVFSGLWWMGAVAALAFVYAAQFVSPRLDPMWFLGERSRKGDRSAALELLDLVQAKQGHDDCLAGFHCSLADLIREVKR